MRPYSTDLRERILAAVERGEHSIRQIVHLFAVSLSFVVRLLQRHRRTGSLQPRPHAGGPTPKFDAATVARLLQLVREQPDATLAELRERLGVPCHLSTIARVLTKHRITRKKKTHHAQERDTPRVQAQRRAFDQRMANVDPAHLVFVDETGATTALDRPYARAPAGTRVEATTPGGWQNVTLIVGLRPTEVVAPIAFPGATDREAFASYVSQALVPQLQEGDVVVWDNLQPHKNPQVVEAIQAVGARVEPLPPWSPDKTPIEELFSKVKSYLRTVAARTVDTVVGAMGQALDLVTPKDIEGWFQDRAAYVYAMH
jgi:transposase